MTPTRQLQVDLSCCLPREAAGSSGCAMHLPCRPRGFPKDSPVRTAFGRTLHIRRCAAGCWLRPFCIFPGVIATPRSVVFLRIDAIVQLSMRSGNIIGCSVSLSINKHSVYRERLDVGHGQPVASEKSG